MLSKLPENLGSNKKTSFYTRCWEHKTGQKNNTVSAFKDLKLVWNVALNRINLMFPS